jgi:hypothetical protein
VYEFAHCRTDDKHSGLSCKSETVAECPDACSVDGVQTREYQRTTDSRLDTLENAIGFHMRDWWQPTKANFFADLKHTQIVDSLTEAGFTGAAAGQCRARTQPAGAGQSATRSAGARA